MSRQLQRERVLVCCSWLFLWFSPVLTWFLMKLVGRHYLTSRKTYLIIVNINDGKSHPEKNELKKNYFATKHEEWWSSSQLPLLIRWWWSDFSDIRSLMERLHESPRDMRLHVSASRLQLTVLSCERKQSRVCSLYTTLHAPWNTLRRRKERRKESNSRESLGLSCLNWLENKCRMRYTLYERE